MIITKQNLDTQVYFNSFTSSRKDLSNSQTHKTSKIATYCENWRFMRYIIKGGIYTHNLISWTCKKCEPCLKYAILERGQKIEAKFAKHPEINPDSLWLITVPNMTKLILKPKQITAKLKYHIKKYGLDVELLLYARHRDEISYLVTGYITLANLEYGTSKVSKNSVIDFFAELNTKFLGPFYGDKTELDLTGFLANAKIGICKCGLPWADHELILTTKDEILNGMEVIPQYEEDFELFKKINFPKEYNERKNPADFMEVTT